MAEEEEGKGVEKDRLLLPRQHLAPSPLVASGSDILEMQKKKKKATGVRRERNRQAELSSPLKPKQKQSNKTPDKQTR